MSIGKITEFKVQSDNWKLYVERLEQYFLVNKIGLDLQVPTLITVMGAESYELLVSLCTPDKPNTKSFKELTSIMANHLQPKPSELAERYKFRHRQQGEAESIADYIAVLKKMSKTCEFGTGLQESLRDQLVCGIKSEIIRQRLFAENKLDFAKAYNLAVSLEAAEKDAAMVVGNAKASGETSAVECQAVYSGRSRRLAGAARGQRGWRAASRGRAAAASSGPRSQQGCQACGGAHEESGCNFKAYVCRVCMRRGHIRRVCPNITPHNTVDVTQCNKQAGQDSDSGSDEEHRVKIGKHHINYIKVGHGPHSCILTPGGLGTIWTNYKPQIEGFDRSKFTLVVWDPPGFGKSYPPEREFTSDSYGNDADTGYELMKILGIPRFSVLGWSAGGSASLVLAAKHPDAVRKLVVWGANAYILPTEIAAYRKIADVNTWAKHLRVPMVEVYGKERFAQYWARWVDCMSVALEAKMDICSEHLKNIKCPTLVLHGCKDPLVDPVHAPYLIENIKKSVLYIYTDGKHDIHIRHAEDFNKRVQDFLLEPAKNDIECH